MTLCGPCMNAARDLQKRVDAEEVMPMYRALHRRHQVGRDEGGPEPA